MTAPAPARADAPNLDLMRKMGSTKGYDPMPPDQHQWQRAKGEPLIHRIWSVLCAHTIRGRETKPGQTVRTPYATKDDGKTPFMAPDLVRELDDDRGNVRRGWIHGEQLGLWHRDDKGRLWLNGTVTETHFNEAKEKRKGDLTLDFTRIDMKKIKHLQKDRQEEFWRVWKAYKSYRSALIADRLAEERKSLDQIDDNIRTAFGLDVRRLETEPREPLEVPNCLLEFVQSPTNTEVSAHHENGFVQSDASLLLSEDPVEVIVRPSVEVPEQRETDGPTPVATPQQAGGDDPARKLLIEEYGRYNPHDTPSEPVVARVSQALVKGVTEHQIRNALRAGARELRAKNKFVSYGFAAHVCEKNEPRWLEEARNEIETLKSFEQSRAKAAARFTLSDSGASEEEKQLARELLGDDEVKRLIERAAREKRLT